MKDYYNRDKTANYKLTFIALVILSMLTFITSVCHAQDNVFV